MKKTTTETITRKVPAENAAGYTEETVSVEVALDGLQFGSFQGAWDTCILCNYTAPKSEMGYIDGRPYCTKHDCYSSTIYELNREEL